MQLFSKFKHWKIEKYRTETFSDGVFAIIITLLVLEIKVPHLGDKQSSAELLHRLKELAPKIISWAACFFFVAVMWVQHHNIFRMAVRIDYGMVWINILLLMFVCFLPFPTALMGEYPHNRLAILLFGLVVTLASFMQVWLYSYMAKNYLKPNYNKAEVMKNVRRSFMMAPLLLIIATAISFISLMLPYFFYLIIPFFFLLPLDPEKAREEERV